MMGVNTTSKYRKIRGNWVNSFR